jgi:hypothetical protein
LAPRGLIITSENYAENNRTVTLEWVPPQGKGSEAIVDYYRISITPKPLSHNATTDVNSLSWNVTLKDNISYTTTITAINCAGEGEASNALLIRTKYGK